MNPELRLSNHDHRLLTTPGSTPLHPPPFEVHSLEWSGESELLIRNKATRVNRFEVIWIRKGKGTITIDLHKQDIINDSIVCLRPGQLRCLETEYGIKGFYIAFSTDFIYLPQHGSAFSFGREPYSLQSSLPLIHVDSDMQRDMSEIVLRMMREYANFFLLRSEILKDLLKVFLVYISRKLDFKTEKSKPDNDIEIVSNFISLLKEHFTTKKMVSAYAKDLCITPNYLNQVVKKATGFTASYHIQQQIILEAKRQAIYSRLRMKEVAYQLGFADGVHFSRFFKNNTGMNFTTFRKLNGEITRAL